MPWEHPWLYPIHNLIGAASLDGIYLVLWTWFVGRHLQVGLKWGTMAISMLGFGWSLGLFAPSQQVSGGILIANVNAYAGEQDMLQGYLSMIGISISFCWKNVRKKLVGCVGLQMILIPWSKAISS